MAEKKEKKPGFFSRIAKYFKDTKSEMKKVSWPDKKTVLNNTGIVIVVVLLSAVLIIGLDAIFGLLLSLVLKGA
ncbi:MAG: preprotein translocase subunit SecE [Oscillospiraceae bacterium]|nr:preprotein translocase subunit SecE [Oscillospiraceae bacterium]